MKKHNILIFFVEYISISFRFGLLERKSSALSLLFYMFFT